VAPNRYPVGKDLTRKGLVIDNQIVFGNPYSNLMVGVDAGTGRSLWATQLGEPMFPQWPQAVEAGTGILLPRHDGYLYKVDWATKRKLWGLFLGKKQFAGLRHQIGEVDPEGHPVVRFSESGNWNPLFGSPLYASAVALPGGLSFVGSDEGYMYCVEG
jgi:hypothetical protein